MKRYILLLFAAVFAASGFSQGRYVKNVRVTKTISLEMSIGLDWDDADSLCFSGDLQPRDMQNLKQVICLTPNLTGIDMRMCTVPGDTLHSIRCYMVNKFMTPKKLRYFRLPKDVKVLSGTFYQMTLANFRIPSSVRLIKSEAFAGTTFLNDLVIEEGLERIKAASFSGAVLPKNIYLPSTLSIVGPECFNVFHREENKGKEVNFWYNRMTPPYFNALDEDDGDGDGGPFYYNYVPKEWTLYVPIGAKEAFAADKHWGCFSKIIETDKLSGNQTNNIREVEENTENADKTYTISGQYVGTDFNSLPSGVYVMRGKKVVK